MLFGLLKKTFTTGPTLGPKGWAAYDRTGQRTVQSLANVEHASSIMTVHRIRLRGPWELDAATGKISPRTVRLPAPWCEIFDKIAGPVRLSRRFHKPTNLGPNDRVSLAIEALPSGADVALNGTSLARPGRPSEGAAVFPTPWLEPTNLLTVEFEVPSASAGNDRTWGEVALLIDSP